MIILSEGHCIEPDFINNFAQLHWKSHSEIRILCIIHSPRALFIKAHWNYRYHCGPEYTMLMSHPCVSLSKICRGSVNLIPLSVCQCFVLVSGNILYRQASLARLYRDIMSSETHSLLMHRTSSSSGHAYSCASYCVTSLCENEWDKDKTQCSDRRKVVRDIKYSCAMSYRDRYFDRHFGSHWKGWCNLV